MILGGGSGRKEETIILVLHSTREGKVMDRWTAHSGGPIIVTAGEERQAHALFARGQHFACPAFSPLMMIGGLPSLRGRVRRCNVLTVHDLRFRRGTWHGPIRAQATHTTRCA